MKYLHLSPDFEEPVAFAGARNRSKLLAIPVKAKWGGWDGVYDTSNVQMGSRDEDHEGLST
jgi:hypothetical protein